MGNPPEPHADDYWKPATPGADPPPVPEYLRGSGEYIPPLDYPDQPALPNAPRHPHPHHIPPEQPPQPPPGKGLAVTAFVFAGLAILVPCLFGWAGIFLGLAANQKGHPLGKPAVYTSIACMLIGFLLIALVRKYVT